MLSMGHYGIYVNDIDRLTDFYVNVFGMSIVCRNQIDAGNWIEQLSEKEVSHIVITKLITDKGSITGSGDMLELIKIIFKDQEMDTSVNIRKFTDIGVSHLGIVCDNIMDTSSKIIRNGGEVIVSPFKRENGNWLSFGKDLEGNFLELIERKS